MNVAVVIGSTRQGRFSDKPARWVTERLAARAGVEVDLLDLRDHPLPFFDQAPPAYRKRLPPSTPLRLPSWNSG